MKKRRLEDLLILIIPFVFYIFFALFDGPIWCNDSASYIEFFGLREPLYPLCIKVFKLIFGASNDFYQQTLVIFQSILLAYATYSFVKYIKNSFNVNNLFTCLILFVFLVVSLMCRFVAKRGSMYSNCLLSEGLSYPLFILFIRYLLDYAINNTKKSYIISSIFSFLLISTRKQLYLSLFLLVIVTVYVIVKSHKAKKGIIELLITCLLVFGGNKTFDYIVTSSMSGSNSTHEGGNRFITTMIIYCSDDDDSKYIDDKETKELFIKVYDICKEKNYLNKNYDNWYDRFNNFKSNYDNIQLDTLVPILREYATSKVDVKEVTPLISHYNDIINASLLIKKLPDMLFVVADNFIAGMMITVSADKNVFLFYSIAIYLLYVIVLIINIKKRGLDNYALFGIMTILSIIVNECIVSLVIFNQTRYTIYNMPLFYISLLLMIYNVFIKKKEN